MRVIINKHPVIIDGVYAGVRNSVEYSAGIYGTQGTHGPMVHKSGRIDCRSLDLLGGEMQITWRQVP